MRNKFIFRISLIVIAMSLLSGCNQILYKPDLNQGNYLAEGAAKSVTEGMTQEQVLYLLGSPITTDVFDKSRWIYIFRQQPSREALRQEKLIVTFDSEGLVSSLKYEPVTEL
ncbi:outer membrane protein assembly factor BamE [Thorsellia anophelis]|uniref:Outer membrane protein assembly factor BamE n=1 Tax=Thorsellia anophelis DSM 18579 TaxID=1123402 RepID=A0A1I0DDY6_9GAMM|nr:outer membrane protein assembly factor BamE [Thorsellia anophelis]SET29940.1 outer membrane protein assembly factor BamE [Thorsellia anophelis DSM 18579]